MFLTEMIGKAINDADWELTEPLRYSSKLLPAMIEVPVGFVTDLASIPRGFRNVFPRNDRHRKAAVIHDYLYSLRGSTGIDRKTCDLVFREAMTVLKVPSWKAYLMYCAVRAAGWLFWRNK